MGRLFPGEMLFPRPGCGESVFDAAFRLPAELLVGEGRVGPDGGDITRAARGETVVELDAVDLLEGCHQLKYGDRSAGADVEDLVRLFHLAVEHAGDGADMGFGQIYDVYVVAQAGPVRGRVVIAEDAQALPFANGGLGDERDKVVGDSARKLADEE